jgi:polyisoprenoid-binding protein YceI
MTGDYVLDGTRTRIGFVGRHTVGPRVRGQFDEFTGGAHLDSDDPARSSVELTIRAASIQTRDRRRDRDLRRRFLDTENHPAITFTSTAVRPTGAAGDTLTGDLTIRGVTRPVSVDFRLAGGDAAEARFTGSAVIDRIRWGVNWNAATGMLVGRTVTLDLDVIAVSR